MCRINNVYQYKGAELLRDIVVVSLMNGEIQLVHLFRLELIEPSAREVDIFLGERRAGGDLSQQTSSRQKLVDTP